MSSVIHVQVPVSNKCPDSETKGQKTTARDSMTSWWRLLLLLLTPHAIYVVYEHFRTSTVWLFFLLYCVHCCDVEVLVVVFVCLSVCLSVYLDFYCILSSWRINVYIFPGYFFLFMNNVLPIAILAWVSLAAYPSSDNQLPNYLNWLTCWTCWPSINGWDIISGNHTPSTITDYTGYLWNILPIHEFNLSA